MTRRALPILLALAACGPSPAPAPAVPPARSVSVAPVPPPRPVLATAGEVTIERGAVVPGPPEAPVEKGTCEVVAHLFDADADRPVNAAVSLWRVGVPEDATWSGGDQCYGGPVTTLEASVRFEEIPPGRYRIACMDQRAGAEDSPEFAVTRGEVKVDVPLLLARTFRARIRIVDAQGRPAPSVARVIRQTPDGAVSDGVPAWVRPRTPKFTPDQVVPGRGPGGPGPHGWPARTTFTTDAGYLGLRNYTETSRTGKAQWTDELTPPGCATIRATVGSDDAANETFAGLAVPLDTLAAHVTRPDGTHVTGSDAVIEASGDAVRCPWDAPKDAERASVFRVRVVAPGFEPLDFDWSLATADTPRVLRPSAPK